MEIRSLSSQDELLTVGPRFTGVPQGSSVVSRVVTHMSALPYPPDRLEPKYNSRPSAEMLGMASAAERLTVGPRLVGVPKVKSAFATSAARHNAKTKITTIPPQRIFDFVVFIFLPFQKLLIFSRRTLCAALFTAVLLLKNRLFGLVDPTLINGKKKAT
ncbi:hypothetical protein ES703_69674 [subsurface metagenome]